MKRLPDEVDTWEPTVFHVTHWKAGSQWIHRILHHLVHDRLVLPHVEHHQFLRQPLQPGKVYPTLYLTREQFHRVAIPPDHRLFVVIRDLRDTLISLYFSIKVSHVYDQPELLEYRAALRGRDHEAGLLLCLHDYLPYCAAIQESWLRAGEPLLRFEDLLDNDLPILEQVLLKQCELRITPERLRQAVLANRFERITQGRPRGQEDVGSHFRKGISGDWRNYFTPRIKDAFQQRFGELLIAAGYETDRDW